MEENTSTPQGTSPMKIIVPVIIILVIVGAVFVLMRGKGTNQSQNSSSTSQTATQQQPTQEAASPTEAVPSNAVSATGSVSGAMTANNQVTVDITASNFTFDKKEIRVKKGDKVTINFSNSDGFHDWVIDAFNARTKRIQAGQTDTVSFVADKAGTFEYYCSVGNHRQMGMRGNLIVQ